jgi:hypothetical protein
LLIRSSFHFAHVGLLTIYSLPTTIAISEDIGKYISADLFAVLIARHHQAAGDADVAVEANIQSLETGLEIRWSRMFREPLDMLGFGKKVSRENGMHKVGRENPIQRLRIVSAKAIRSLNRSMSGDHAPPNAAAARGRQLCLTASK